MRFSFDGRVLIIVLNGQVNEVVESGDSWPSSYRVIASPETKLPTRFESPTVGLSVFECYVRLDGLRLVLQLQNNKGVELRHFGGGEVRWWLLLGEKRWGRSSGGLRVSNGYTSA